MRTSLSSVLLTFFSLVSLFPGEIQAATFTVNVFDDPTPVAAPNGCSTGGRCSLREAALQSNAASDEDTIVLGVGTYNLTIPDAGTPETGDLDFNGFSGIGAVRIEGVSAAETIINAAASLNDRLIEVAASDFAIRISNLTIQGGNSTFDGGGLYTSTGATIPPDPDPVILVNVNFIDNHTTGSGGGAFISGGKPDLNIDGGTYHLNTADQSGGGLAISNGACAPAFAMVKNVIITENQALQGIGGGIYQSACGGVRFENIIVTGNSAKNPADDSGDGLGGGIFSGNGGDPFASEIINSTITGNQADGSTAVNQAGGGVLLTGSKLIRIVNSTFSDNQGLNDLPGGGAYISSGGGLEILGSTFEGNSAGLGGGLYHSGSGGTIQEITNSTFSRNTAMEGGGIWITRPIGSLNNVTLSENTATAGDGGGIFNGGTSITLQNSIFSANGSSGNGDDCGGNPFSSGGYNLFASPQNTDCDTDGVDAGTALNDSTADPLLAALANNGGPTLTYALLAGSPAIDGGNPLGCLNGSGADLTVDQRGQTRPIGADCDIGAVEMGQTDLIMTKTADAATVEVGEDIVYTLTVQNNGPSNALAVNLSDTLPGSVTVISFSSQCSQAGGVINCELGPLNAGASVNVTITVTADAAGQITNTATASGSELDSNPDNSTDSVTVTVTEPPNPDDGGCALSAVSVKQGYVSWLGLTLIGLGAWVLRRSKGIREFKAGK